MRISSLAYGAALAMAASIGISTTPVNLDVGRMSAVMPQKPVISKPSKRIRKTTTFKRNGKREVARRLRQIAAGQLTRSNGLVTAEELYGKRAA